MGNPADRTSEQVTRLKEAAGRKGRPTISGTGRGRAAVLKLSLSLAATVLALLLVEVGFRVYYWRGDIATVIPYGDDDEVRRRAWIAAHRNDFADDQWMRAIEYHPRRGWTLKANLRAFSIEGQPPFNTNSQGVRGVRDIPYAPPAGSQRIVLVGDSYTFGYEESDEFAWGAQLEARLANCEVINLGVPAYGVDQQLLMLQAEGVKYHPDIVIVGIFVEDAIRSGLAFRDYAKPLFVLDKDRLRLTNVPVPTPDQILAQDEGRRPLSYAYHFLRNRAGVLLGSFRPLDEPYDDYIMALNREIVREIKATADSVDAKVLLLIIPKGTRTPRLQIEDAAERWAQEAGTAFLNLRDALRDAEEREDRPVYAGHFSRFGNFVAAEAIAARLTDLRWATPIDESDLPEILARLKEGVAAADQDVRTLLSKSALLKKEGRIAEAEAIALAIIGANPKDPRGYTALAAIVLDTGRFRDAADALRTAVELKPDDAQFHADLATALLRLGNQRRSAEMLQEAVRECATALSLNPQLPDVHLKLGTGLLLLGRLDGAIKALDEAVRREPEKREARLSLADALVRADQPQRAVTVLEELVRREPKYLPGLAQLGTALYRCNRFAHAAKAFRLGLEIDPTDLSLTGTLAWLLATCADDRVRDGREAVRLAKLLGAKPSGAALDCLAAAYAEVGDFNAAIEAAQRAKQLAVEAKNHPLAQAIEARLELYRARLPYREAP